MAQIKQGRGNFIVIVAYGPDESMDHVKKQESEFFTNRCNGYSMESVQVMISYCLVI